MKIVIIGGISDFKVIRGGVESVVYNLSTQFVQYPEISFYLLGHNINDHSNENTHFQDIHIPFPKLGLALNYFFFRTKIINRIEKEINPDLYHFQGTVPNLLLLNNRISAKTVVTQHGILSEEFKHQASFTRKLKFIMKVLLEKYTLPKVKNLIFISRYNKKHVINKYPQLNNIKHTLIYNPVHPSFFEKNDPVESEARIYFVGELKKRKGLHDLLNALKVLKSIDLNIKLEIIGDFIEQDYKKDIELILSDGKLDGLVTFHGWQSKEGILNISNQCNIFILPSYQETLPVSIAEAMALGKAVIATDLPGVKEMIEDDESGILYEIGNVNELSQKIQLLAQDSNVLAGISKSASIRAKELFNSKNILNSTVSFYKEVLNGIYNET